MSDSTPPFTHASCEAFPPIAGVSFQPWIGIRWNDPGYRWGSRLLIVGESHYGAGAACQDPGLTRTVVTWYLRGDTPGQDRLRSKRFFNVVSTLVTGRPLSLRTPEDRAQVWEQFAFYNFVPVSVSKGVRPTESQFQAGQAPFLAVLRALTPRVILVLGKATWMAMPPYADERRLTVNDHATYQRRYAIDGAPSALAMRVNHPRWISYARWQPNVDRLFDDAARDPGASLSP